MLGVGQSLASGNVVATVFGDTAFGTYVVQACADGTDVLRESATGPQGSSELNNCLNTTTTAQVIP